MCINYLQSDIVKSLSFKYSMFVIGICNNHEEIKDNRKDKHHYYCRQVLFWDI